MVLYRAIALLALFVASSPLFASAGSPLVKAYTCANGKYLVLAQWELTPAAPGLSQQIVRTTYRVMTLEPFINEKDRLHTSGSFFSDTGDSWEFTLEGSFSYEWPMVSDNGQYVALISPGAWRPDDSALRIYHRKANEHTGELLSSLTTADLWSPTPFVSTRDTSTMITDSTPLWFASLTLDFSADNRYFQYTDKKKGTYVVNLKTGSVQELNPASH